jgi:uncharacterized protein (TIGR02246 family)
MPLTAEDSLAILQLVTRADACASTRDADGYAALFTEDGTMGGDKGAAEGRAALRDTVARVWAAEPAGTLHLTLNAWIDESGDEPTVDSMLLMVTPAPSPQVLGTAHIRQTIRRTQAGWRISARTIEVPPAPGPRPHDGQRQ